MSDLLKTFSVLYLLFSAFIAIVIFSFAKISFIFLIVISLGIVFQSLMILMMSLGISKLLEQMDESGRSIGEVK